MNTDTTGKPGANPVSDLLRQCKKSFVFVAILTLVIEVLSITPIVFMWNMFDRVISSRSEVTLVSLTALVMLAYGFWSGLEWVRTRMMIRISLRIDWDIAARVFDTSFRRYVARKDVDVHQVLGDVVTLRQFLTGGALLALMSAPYAIIFIFIGWAFHPYLAIFILVATIVQLLAAYSTSRITTPALREANTASAEAKRLAAQSLRQSDTALALGMQGNIRRRWFEKHQHFLGLQVNASESAGLVGGATNFLSHAMPSLQMALACWLAIEGVITGGMVIAASFLLNRAIGPIKQIMGSWSSIQTAKQSLERLNAMVAEDDVVSERMPLPAPKGTLDVADLVAQPATAKRPIVFNLNFKAEPGQVLALVGPSAAGKTSLIKLLVGLWEPTRGHVRLDGAEIAPWIRDDLGQYIGYVPQDIELFEGTVAENLARLGPIDPDKVVAAAKAIGMHEAILAFPQGYETKLGETGYALTGGQKQRLAIARAVYGDPVYVVLDEPNANLDDEGERALIKLIRELKARQTLVVFSSHRPKLLEVADLVLVLKDGQQVAFGPVAQVLGQIKSEVKAETPPQPPKVAAPVPAAPVQSVVKPVAAAPRVAVPAEKPVQAPVAPVLSQPVPASPQPAERPLPTVATQPPVAKVAPVAVKPVAPDAQVKPAAPRPPLVGPRKPPLVGPPRPGPGVLAARQNQAKSTGAVQ
ncbi:type I secretion system permease/ATPase [Macromonas bipunctata]|uniref:type I secretion system permease/ATPase n=1 Tax=Macromonas bipunctata TaxID=183670 RepID=UPI001475A7F2|nr:type I secretion system permease/ATPase [Macromonas bipunctata]